MLVFHAIERGHFPFLFWMAFTGPLFCFVLSLLVGWAFGHFETIKTPTGVLFSASLACLIVTFALFIPAVLISRHLAHAESLGIFETLLVMSRLPILRWMVLGFWLYFSILALVIRWRTTVNRRRSMASNTE